MNILNNTYHEIIMLMSIGLFISTAEYLVKIKIFATDGLLSWNVMQIRWENSSKNWLAQTAFKFINPRGLSAIFVLRCALLIALAFAPVGSLNAWLCLTGLLITVLLSSLVTFYGSDGSDQMTLLIIVTLFLVFCPVGHANPTLLKIGIWFVGLQSCLSYAVAGLAKLFSNEWRRGTAIKDVFNTRTYGSPWALSLLNNRPWLNKFLCWNVILMETLFPLSLFLPFPLAVCFWIWGFTFHFLTAVIMGLNSFLWAFMATYPAIYFIHTQLA
ncbi:hypothetical protein CKK33_16550 [Mucilaginibacter sp. MD40]|uniref:hypothetical protein n=1 Tax=Mucilaginibacter sp. MD40 TaxID=2029590 RepID=UPI000BACC1D1|nr:hypothetical protein [Mucilaginibacter sp. MD40]PAW95019.1 hypothetical protein CKK33_16550 [Mucilaginibacter sp. MD40]